MRNSNTFHPRRLGLLIRREVLVQYRTYLVMAGALFGIFFTVNLLSLPLAGAWDFDAVYFPLALFIGGFLFTTWSFQELHDARGRAYFLSLPATAIEKLLGKWLISGPGFALATLVLYFLFSICVVVLARFFLGVSPPLFDPLSLEVAGQIRGYLVLQSIFLLGALSFRSNAFLKTLLALFVLIIAYTIFVGLCFYITSKFIGLSGRPYLAFGFFELFTEQEGELPPALVAIGRMTGLGARILFGYLMAPFLWIVACLKLRELEV